MSTLFGEKTLNCDTAVSAVGFKSRDTNTVKRSLERKGMEVFVIGSAVEPGRIFEATQTGFWTAVEI